MTTTTTTSRRTATHIEVETLIKTIASFSIPEEHVAATPTNYLGVVDVSDTESECASDNDFDCNDDTPDGSDTPSGPPPSYTAAGAEMVKKYRPTHPSALKVFSGPCFLLAHAQETGLYQKS